MTYKAKCDFKYDPTVYGLLSPYEFKAGDLIDVFTRSTANGTIYVEFTDQNLWFYKDDFIEHFESVDNITEDETKITPSYLKSKGWKCFLIGSDGVSFDNYSIYVKGNIGITDASTEDGWKLIGETEKYFKTRTELEEYVGK